MAYPAEYIQKSLHAAAWPNRPRVSNYKSCRRRYYFDESYSSKRRNKVRYGTRVLVLAHDGAFVLTHDFADWFSNCESWLTEKKRFDVLKSLEEAAKAKNTSTFLRRVKAIEWNRRSAAEFTRAIDLALMAGAHLSARNLAEQGAEIHFDSEELEKYARILAPPRVSNRQPSIVIKPNANITWLRANRDQYKGRWVALKDGVLIADAGSHDALIAQIGQTKRTGILVTNIY
jgi:hypothetical protein